MKINPGFFLIFMQVGLFLFWWFFLPSGRQRIVEEREEYNLCVKQLQDFQQQKNEFAQRLKQWDTDPFLFEKYARENLGMSRSGEEIIVSDAN